MACRHGELLVLQVSRLAGPEPYVAYRWQSFRIKASNQPSPLLINDRLQGPVEQLIRNKWLKVSWCQKQRDWGPVFQRCSLQALRCSRRNEF